MGVWIGLWLDGWMDIREADPEKYQSNGGMGVQTWEQLAEVQNASEGSNTGAVVGNVPLLKSVGHFTVRLDSTRETYNLTYYKTYTSCFYMRFPQMYT